MGYSCCLAWPARASYASCTRTGRAMSHTLSQIPSTRAGVHDELGRTRDLHRGSSMSPVVIRTQVRGRFSLSSKRARRSCRRGRPDLPCACAGACSCLVPAPALASASGTSRSPSLWPRLQPQPRPQHAAQPWPGPSPSTQPLALALASARGSAKASTMTQRNHVRWHVLVLSHA